ncbi:MAG: DEAD/DEAH box helicase [Firmicutes bacterium]|nr:DEAD/DEAH box helicase [Bacillota bacterium]MCM1401395.1 DEAD/DEAH box helicase [Bacteroides sp.]MCM1477335.1 DEAD/DEAH box helicase [Bacteroides sp.]
MRFDDFDFNYDLLDALDAMHFEECTPIQEKAIPAALAGRDLIAVAQTGTGKTAAYILPVLNRIADGDFPTDAINCIVMAPTRELAMQIDNQLEGFGYYMSVSSLPIYGGTDGATFARQQKGLKLGADVVIATPGRLLAHLQMGYVDLSKVSFFILDEADRMLDMGFYDDIMQIVRHLPRQRQTLMFSATMPAKIQQLAKSILTDPEEIKIAVSRPADKIHQRVAFCGEIEKVNLLKGILTQSNIRRVIIFASSKLKVKDLARDLRKSGLKIGEMHSDLDQLQRDEVMHKFKTGKVDILVATDIVARGIDIDDITMVVNFDVPHDAEDYVHRIGRTARADADGEALTFVSERDRRRWAGIEKFLGKKIERIPLSGAEESVTDNPAPRKKNNRNRKRNFKPRNKQVPAGEQQQSAETQGKSKRRRPWNRKKRNPGSNSTPASPSNS